MAGKRRLNFASFTTKERLIFPAARAISCYLRTGVLLESRRLAVTVVPETMPTPYSEDLRLRVVNAVENGKTTREVATLFQVRILPKTTSLN